MNTLSRLTDVFSDTGARPVDPGSGGRMDELAIGAMLQTLWRGKWWIAIVTAIFILMGGYQVFVVATPRYSAEATVVLETRRERVVDFESVLPGLSSSRTTINTQIEIMSSRALIGKLVDRLDLMSDPEFNTSLPSNRRRPLFSFQNPVQMLMGRLTGVLRRYLTPLRRDEDEDGPVSRTRTERDFLDAAIGRVRGSLNISNIRETNAFRIRFTTEKAEKSARMANALAELYVLDQIEVKAQATERANAWLTDRVVELQGELEDAEAAVEEFVARTDLTSPEALAGLNRQIKDLRDRRISSEAALMDAQERLAALDAARNGSDFGLMAELAGDPALTRALQLAGSGTNDGARVAFLARYDQIVSQAALEQSRAETQLEALRDTITEMEARVESQSAELVQLQQLQRESEASSLIYEYFLGRLKETSAQQGIHQADSRIISRAIVRRAPTSPRPYRVVMLSTILGLFIGCGLVLLREARHPGIRTAADLEDMTGLTVLGRIPRIPARKRINVLKYLSEKPNSAAAEAIRDLRTSLLLSNIDKTPQIVMSTSSVPGEGKTMLTLALARNMASMGKKVLAIEGDIRKRTFGEYFDLQGRPGLLSVLSGKLPLAEAAMNIEMLDADILPGELSSANAADIFSSERFATFLEELRGVYDTIIIDTPPVLAVSDARVIGQLADAILYSVKWDSTPRARVREGIQMFETVNARLSGLVLTQVDVRKMARYGYGSGYGYGGGQGYGGYGTYGDYGTKRSFLHRIGLSS